MTSSGFRKRVDMSLDRLLHLGRQARLSIRMTGRKLRGRSVDWAAFQSSADLCADHFAFRCTPDHINERSMTLALSLLTEKPATIIETGVSCRGADSTRLFDSYVRSFGGRFESVDINPSVVKDISADLCPNSAVACMDSVQFLTETAERLGTNSVDFLYLDSYDIDFENPRPAADHCLREFRAIYPALKQGAVVLIDDSPSAPELVPGHNASTPRDSITGIAGNVPGKGMLVGSLLEENGIRRLTPGYQALYIMDGEVAFPDG